MSVVSVVIAILCNVHCSFRCDSRFRPNQHPQPIPQPHLHENNQLCPWWVPSNHKYVVVGVM